MSSAIATAGLVLAAGASTRMGYPKALLPLPNGTLLAMHQMRVLRAGGCERVAVVLGSNANAIATKITDGEVIKNPDWQRARLTSIQAGLRALPNVDGYLLLPVDSVGIQAPTIAEVLKAARTCPPAVRPFFAGQPGRVLWISAGVAQELLTLPAEDTRLDQLLAERVIAVPVEDAAVLNNVNTPEDWAEIRLRV